MDSLKNLIEVQNKLIAHLESLVASQETLIQQQEVEIQSLKTQLTLNGRTDPNPWVPYQPYPWTPLPGTPWITYSIGNEEQSQKSFSSER